MDKHEIDRHHLVALLAAVEEPARAAELPDEAGLLKVARRHRLSPLLSALAGKLLPPGLAAPFRHDRLVTTARNLALGAAAEECVQSLAAQGIPAIVLKGISYEQQIYAASGVRASGDLDLLVPNEQRRAAFEVFDRLGFEPHASPPGFDDPDYHEVAWSRSGIEVDLHLALAPFVRCGIDYREIWSEARPLRLGRTEARALHPTHAVLFHALHMAVDHFAIPAIYLVDLSRLVSRLDAPDELTAKARAWRIHRPLATALALAAAFLPRWRQELKMTLPPAPLPGVVGRYGAIVKLPRPQQLFRKLMHFDSLVDAVRYGAVQSRRNLREQFERHVRKRSPRERLSLPPSG